jgi:hypothetical protein
MPRRRSTRCAAPFRSSGPMSWRAVIYCNQPGALSSGLSAPSVHGLPVFEKTRHGTKNNFRQGGSEAQQPGQLLDYRSR